MNIDANVMIVTCSLLPIIQNQISSGTQGFLLSVLLIKFDICTSVNALAKLNLAFRTRLVLAGHSTLYIISVSAFEKANVTASLLSCSAQFAENYNFPYIT